MSSAGHQPGEMGLWVEFWAGGCSWLHKLLLKELRGWCPAQLPREPVGMGLE